MFRISIAFFVYVLNNLSCFSSRIVGLVRARYIGCDLLEMVEKSAYLVGGTIGNIYHIVSYLSKVIHCGLSAWGAIAVADKHYIFPPRQRRASYERLTTSTLGSTANSYRSQRHIVESFKNRTSATASNRSGLHRQKYNIIFYCANF